MFVVLNLRNIYDNFVKYGLRFLQYPTEFFPITAFLGFLLELVFLELGYRINRLRFHNLLSDETVVNYYLFLEISFENKSSRLAYLRLSFLQ
jgi:hypothetical protein